MYVLKAHFPTTQFLTQSHCVAFWTSVFHCNSLRVNFVIAICVKDHRLYAHRIYLIDRNSLEYSNLPECILEDKCLKCYCNAGPETGGYGVSYFTTQALNYRHKMILWNPYIFRLPQFHSEITRNQIFVIGIVKFIARRTVAGTTLAATTSSSNSCSGSNISYRSPPLSPSIYFSMLFDSDLKRLPPPLPHSLPYRSAPPIRPPEMSLCL